MKKTVEVTFNVRVAIDETKFTPEFMQDFREFFYGFNTLDEHIKHIAGLKAEGALIEDFTEGYGKLSDMGIKADIYDITVEIEE